MKKTLIALAAVAASSAAFAQSSVTLYGSLDLSVESVKGEKSVTRVTSGNHTTSRFGVKGTEDLGGGLKAKFNLEAPVSADTGAVSGNFWNRQAWLGLQGGFGELRLGRQDTPIGAIAGNTSLLGGQAYDDFKIAGTLAGNDARRTDNAITYILPKLADGLTATLQYSTKLSGAEAANDDEGKHYGLSVQYAANGFGAGLGYVNAKADTTGDTKAKGVLVYASYDFGMAKLTGYYNRDSVSGAAEDLKLYGVRVDVPVSDTFALQASLSQAKDVDMNGSDDNDATIVALKGTYSLSKRTAVYGLLTNVSNDKGAGIGIVSTFVALLIVVLLPIGGLRITDAISWVLAPVVVWLVTALATLFLPMIFLKKKVVEARESRP